MTVSATPMLGFNVTETLIEDALNTSVSHSAFDMIGSLTLPTADIPVTMVSFQDVVLTGGSVTLDLTAIAGIKGVIQNANTKKIQGIILRNPKDNGDITLEPGGTNGADIDTEVLRGSAVADTVKIIFSPEVFADVDGTHKTITLSGTADETVHLGLLIG